MCGQGLHSNRKIQNNGGIDGRGNNSKVIRHMGKNIAEHKRTKQDKIKRIDKGGYMVHWDVVEELYVHPRGPTVTVNDKLKD